MKIYGDILTRMQTVTDLSAMVDSCVKMGNPVSFSIEGEWGKGKTWIVDKLAASLQGIDLSEKDGKENRTWGRYLVFKYSAWEKDYYDEPLLAIIITLINQLNKELLPENLVKSELKVLFEETKDILEESLRAISKRVIGIDVVDIGKKGINIFKKIKANTKISVTAEYSENIEKDIKIVVKALNKLSKDIPIVFIVDELDRCIPLHAIKTMERLHHIFGKVKSSVTIISVNEQQLVNIVQQMFGTNISFEAYLRKFVDFRVALNAGQADSEELKSKLNEFFNLFGEEGDTELQDEIITNVCSFMTAREFEKVCKSAILCHKLVGIDTSRFSRDCAMAEILLFSCKIASEKEGMLSNILPQYGNNPKSNLGIYIKKFLRKMSRDARLELSRSVDVVLFICANGLMLQKAMNLTYMMEDEALLSELMNFYNEYARYYKMMVI